MKKQNNFFSKKKKLIIYYYMPNYLFDLLYNYKLRFLFSKILYIEEYKKYDPLLLS